MKPLNSKMFAIAVLSPFCESYSLYGSRYYSSTNAASADLRNARSLNPEARYRLVSINLPAIPGMPQYANRKAFRQSRVVA